MRADSMARLVSVMNEKEADRLRGEIRVLDKLIELPGVISEYLKGVSTGTMKKITESKETINV